MDQPNVLVVLTDQLTRSVLSCYGDRNWQSQHIDRFAREGVQCNQAVSSFPVCVPFRFTLMTGHYAHTRMVPNIDWRMSPAERTIADEFNDADYQTIYVGKWHLWGGYGKWAKKRPVPREHQGRWQKWLGFEFRNDLFDTVYFEDDDPTPHPIDGYQTDGLFDLAIDYLTNKRDTARPFCCCLSVEAPHPKREAPESYEQKWRSKTDFELPDNFMKPPDGEQINKVLSAEQYDDAEEIRRIYYAMVENLDDNMGKLYAALRDSGLDQNTIVVFMSDHGELAGCHAMLAKGVAYEESNGIPLVVWGPNCGIPQGREIDVPIVTEDLMPTICGFAGITPRNALPGTDVSPLIRGEIDTLDRPGVMLESLGSRPYRGFRSARYTYTVIHGEQGMVPWQLFDLEDDPYQLQNRIEDPSYQDIAAQHHGWLRQRMLETGDHEWLGPAFGHEQINAWPLVLERGSAPA